MCSSTPDPNQAGAAFTDARGRAHALPLFLPVYQPRTETFQLASSAGASALDGLIVNAFFLYKQRELRRKLTRETGLHAFVGFDGLIATDSGAFQGFSRQLYLKNKDIVRFQDRIGSDIIAPLDLVTPPGDKRSTAQQKLDATNRRVREALDIAEHGMVAGVQQGGRFLDLRRASIEALMAMGVRYVAIGSLVPFFTRNHDLALAGRMVRDARGVMGPELPMHIYGAGDPVELPFFAALGGNVFDSASYSHYADSGAYMTPYGALTDLGPVTAGEYTCTCPECQRADGPSGVVADRVRLALHNLWTIVDTVADLRTRLSVPGALERRLAGILEVHTQWFPQSRLRASWDELHG